MHETRFINEIFTVLKQKLGAASGQVVVNARLSPFSHVADRSLQESFKELIKGKNFKNVRLKVLPLEILLECKNCKRSARITKKVFGCPFCKSADVDIQMDKEFFVESIEIESKEKEAKNGN
jgi:Zn finger protein HypA/HybF involved in hydrogenase expression